MALLLRPSDFEEEEDFEMVCVFMSAQAGVCAWFENSNLKPNVELLKYSYLPTYSFNVSF